MKLTPFLGALALGCALASVAAAQQAVTLSLNSAQAIGATWTTITPSPGRTIRRVADATGGGCVWTPRTSGQVAGEGVPFSLTGAPGAEDFGFAPPGGSISVRCSTSVTVTVIEG